MKQNTRRLIALVLVISIALPSASFAAIFDAGKVNFMINMIQQFYYEALTDDEIADAIYHGIMQELDPYSSYFNAKEYSNFMTNTTGEFGGVGISVTYEDGRVIVVSPIEGTPGAASGIIPDDVIIGVDGRDVTDLTLEEVVNLIRGEPGTNVTLKILRGDKELSFTITRAIITIESVRYEIRQDGIAYLRISQFSNETAGDVRAAVNAFRNAEVKGLVVDLRNNPGGLLTSVIEIADVFLAPGKEIVSIDYRSTPDEEFLAQSLGYTDVPMVVMINGGSASASEIFASAMQENNRATIFGTKSFGKGTVQNLFNLSGGEGLKITIAQYFGPNQTKINGLGVTPDVVFDIDYAAADSFAPMPENHVIYKGEASLNIYGLQQRLNALGYELEEDGLFGPNTLAALQDFQKSQNLPVTNYLSVYMKNTIDGLINKILVTGEVDLALENAVNLLDN